MRSDWMNMAYYWICPRITVEALWKGRIESEQERKTERARQRWKGRMFSVNEQIRLERDKSFISVGTHWAVALHTQQH